jgi:hypothetical protein
MQPEAELIRIKTILELVGRPKEFLQQKMNEYLEKIKEDRIIIISQNISEPIEQKEGVWSVVCDIELVIKGLDNLVGFCIDYMPASVEIIKPEKFEFEERIFTGFINDILAKLHKVDIIAKQLGTENHILKENMTKIIFNNILVLIKLGMNKPEILSKLTGIEVNELKKFLDRLVEEKKIKESEGTYSIA